MPQVTSTTIIDFIKEIAAKEGFPEYIVTDNGTPFVSAEFEKFLKLRAIKHNRSAAYWPRGNSVVERFNRTFKQWVLDWDRSSSLRTHVLQRLALYRATPHCATGASPSELLHGRMMRLNLPVIVPKPPRVSPEERNRKQSRRNKKAYDVKLGVKPSGIAEGDRVYVKKRGHVAKGTSRFAGPLTVVRRVGKWTFKLSDGSVRNAAHLAPADQVSAESADADPSTNPDEAKVAEASPQTVARQDSSEGEDPSKNTEDDEATNRTGETPSPPDQQTADDGRVQLPPSSTGRQRWLPQRLS